MNHLILIWLLNKGLHFELCIAKLLSYTQLYFLIQIMMTAQA